MRKESCSAVRWPDVRRAALIHWPTAFALTLILLPSCDLHATGDGPKVHGPTPVGINGLVLSGSSLQDANRTFDPSLINPFSRFDTEIISLGYMRTLEVKNRHVMFMGIVRGGQATRKVLDPGGNEISSSKGLADPYVGVSVNLMGLPPMDRETFRSFEPGLKVNFLLGANAPLGEYDKKNVINLGANRWTIRFALPITRPFTGLGSMPGALGLIPNLLLFTENKDRKLEQDPLFSLEGYLTQHFTQRSWGSLGFLYDRGGKTRTNGVTSNGSQRSLSLTMTLGMSFSKHWGAQFRYGQSVANNEYGLVGEIYQFKLARFF